MSLPYSCREVKMTYLQHWSSNINLLLPLSVHFRGRLLCTANICSFSKLLHPKMPKCRVADARIRTKKGQNYGTSRHCAKAVGWWFALIFLAILLCWMKCTLSWGFTHTGQNFSGGGEGGAELIRRWGGWLGGQPPTCSVGRCHWCFSRVAGFPSASSKSIPPSPLWREPFFWT